MPHPLPCSTSSVDEQHLVRVDEFVLQPTRESAAVIAPALEDGLVRPLVVIGRKDAAEDLGPVREVLSKFGSDGEGVRLDHSAEPVAHVPDGKCPVVSHDLDSTPLTHNRTISAFEAHLDETRWRTE